jgi:hypothetical protein
MPKPKRWRIPNAKAGELKATWGKPDPWNKADLCYVWGEGCAKADGAILCTALEGNGFQHNYGCQTKVDLGPNFRAELEKRGYDITTLKFSVRKKSPQ